MGANLHLSRTLDQLRTQQKFCSSLLVMTQAVEKTSLMVLESSSIITFFTNRSTEATRTIVAICPLYMQVAITFHYKINTHTSICLLEGKMLVHNFACFLARSQIRSSYWPHSHFCITSSLVQLFHFMTSCFHDLWID